MTPTDLTVAQVAQACQCSTKTIMRAIDRGELVAYQVQIRGGWRVEPGALDAWKQLRSNRRRERRVSAPAATPIMPAAAPRGVGGGRRSRRAEGDGRVAA